ncbi:YbiU family protein [Bauldia sp.]|uniref:YbiU family protein n=1 Tax=Bauldia sp. TaxID=2575872 RepID=UPI003BACA4F9
MATATAEPEIDVRAAVSAFKRSVEPRRDALRQSFAEVGDHMSRAADAIQADQAAGRSVIPEIDYSDIAAGTVSDETKAAIRRTGCAIVRQVYPETVANDWFAELCDYLDTNHYEEREVEKRSLDKYFSALKAGKPQVFNVYWSKPQVNARQGESLARTRSFLDRLWHYEGVFDPDLQCAYADRVRRRVPGDTTLGLSPHMDAGTVERWIDPGYQGVYEAVFAGDWRSYNPFDGTHRLRTEEIPSPAVASVFRTYQGWTALTRQGPSDGTLKLVPVAEGISYVLLRALQDDVAEDDLCGAAPGRALGVSREWHPEMMECLVSIPEVRPGDTVWWHTDICHAVADEHTGSEYASVIYIGSAPDCPKNRAYLPRQREAFLAGKSAPDFAAMDFEVDFVGRATEADLTDLGRKQMGF